MAHDLPDCIEVQAGAIDMLRPFGLDVGAEAREDGGEHLAADDLARCDANHAALGVGLAGGRAR